MQALLQLPSIQSRPIHDRSASARTVMGLCTQVTASPLSSLCTIFPSYLTMTNRSKMWHLRATTCCHIELTFGATTRRSTSVTFDSITADPPHNSRSVSAAMSTVTGHAGKLSWVCFCLCAWSSYHILSWRTEAKHDIWGRRLVVWRTTDTQAVTWT